MDQLYYFFFFAQLHGYYERNSHVGDRFLLMLTRCHNFIAFIIQHANVLFNINPNDTE